MVSIHSYITHRSKTVIRTKMRTLEQHKSKFNRAVIIVENEFHESESVRKDWDKLFKRRLPHKRREMIRWKGKSLNMQRGQSTLGWKRVRCMSVELAQNVRDFYEWKLAVTIRRNTEFRLRRSGRPRLYFPLHLSLLWILEIRFGFKTDMRLSSTRLESWRKLFSYYY